MLALAGYAREAKDDRSPPATCKVERRDIVESCSEDGILEAHRIHSFYPDVGNSRLIALRVKEGDAVKKGDVLFEFDRRRVDSEKQLLQAKLDAAEIKLGLLGERRTGAEPIRARQDLVRAEQQHKDAVRARDIRKEMAAAGLASAADLDRLDSEAKAAELGVELARLQASEFDTHAKSPEIVDLEVQIVECRNALSELALSQQEFTGVAPFDGRIVRVNDTIKNLQSVASDVNLRFRPGLGPLLILADTSVMRVLTHFFERDVARIRTGQKAYVTAPHVPGKVFEGTVTSVGELGDTMGETTTVLVEVLVNNADQLLKTGLKARTEIVLAQAEAVPTVPVEFLRRSGEETFVWRRKGAGPLEAAPVKTGVSDGRCIEIKSGLQEDDILVME
jgi:multidrug efflux pump subunit AcrA (membrane-fusion protein)